jgi:transglutaminase-like putative cysteine protease
MTKAELQGWKPTRARTLWLTASLSLVILPHAVRMPFWVTIGFAILAYWRIEHVFRGLTLPGRWSRVALSIAIVIGVFLSYGTLFGRSAGIAALAVLAGMKLLETDSIRDAYAVVFLSFFLIITNFLYSQSIPTGVYMLVVTAVSGATLMSINSHESGLQLQQRLRYVTTMLLQAVPLMLFLFVLFPRIPGPLWGLPKDAHSAATGLSDSMSPGSISQLSQSSEVAFRVEFDGTIPGASKLYWRGPIFTYTDGRSWSGREPHLAHHVPEIRAIGNPLYYTLTIEPHAQHWIFALDVPAPVRRDVRMSDEYQLLSTSRIRERKRYHLRSFPNARMTHITDAQRRAALELPGGAHPRTRALARSWRTETTRDEDIIAIALNYFRSRPFFYTLRPPLLLDDPVDQFLFDSKRGFCEHYAAAFTILMRAAGIPTRVVTGYQGGEVNPLGDYVIVRQRDAHAWTEVWLDSQGWTRVDPTAAVSPQRIELGMDATLPRSIGPAVLGLEATGSLAELFRNLRHGWDTVNNSWNLWVLGYGPDRQQELLAKIGLNAGDWRRLLLALVAVLCVGLGTVALWLTRTRHSQDRVSRAYGRFCNKLGRSGLARREAEGPRDYAARVCMSRPELEDKVREVSERYVRLRYANTTSDIGGFEKAVSGFKP